MKLIEIIEQPNSIERLSEVRKNGELLVPYKFEKTYRSAISKQMRDMFPDRSFTTKVIKLDENKVLKIKRIA